MNSNSFLKIAGCSYEGSLFGWDIVGQSAPSSATAEVSSKKGKSKPAAIDSNLASTESLDTVLSYGLNVCEGCLKAVAVSQRGKHLVTGGTDERIRIFDLKQNCAVGELSTHTGAITSLHFFGDSYLMSGSEDSTLVLWRVHDWQCVHILGGHKAAVTDFSIHPTGKLALSVSKDNTMKLWNLVQGRCAFTRRLKKPADSVLWHESGLYYSLTIGNEIQLYLATDNSCVSTIVRKQRINKGTFSKISGAKASAKPADIAAAWRIAVVCEDKTLSLYNFAGEQTATVDLSALGSGRPRDLWSGAPNTHSSSAALPQSIAGHCIVVVTSTGLTLTINAATMELPVRESDEELGVLGNCLLSHHQIKVEPRLTAVVGWSAAAAGASDKPDGVEDVMAAVPSRGEAEAVEAVARDSDDEEEEEKALRESKKGRKANKAENANKKRKTDAK